MSTSPRRKRTNPLSADTGAAMVEYAFLIAFIAMVALVGVTTLGININAFFTGITL